MSGPPVSPAEVHRFEQAGHYVLEDESEALPALIQGFLRSAAGVSWQTEALGSL